MLPPDRIIFLAAVVEIENEHKVILCDIFPVPSTLPGTKITSSFFVTLSIFVKFTTRFYGFKERFASFAQIGALFFFEACFSSLTKCKTTWFIIKLIPSVTQI